MEGDLTISFFPGWSLCCGRQNKRTEYGSQFLISSVVYALSEILLGSNFSTQLTISKQYCLLLEVEDAIWHRLLSRVRTCLMPISVG